MQCSRHGNGDRDHRSLRTATKGEHVGLWGRHVADLGRNGHLEVERADDHITLSVHSPGQGSCKKGSKEEDATGSVTGGTSTYTKAGNPVAIRACFTQQGGTLSLVKGSKAQL